VKYDGPHKTKCEFGVSIDDLISANVHQAYLHHIANTGHSRDEFTPQSCDAFIGGLA